MQVRMMKHNLALLYRIVSETGKSFNDRETKCHFTYIVSTAQIDYCLKR